MMTLLKRRCELVAGAIGFGLASVMILIAQAGTGVTPL